MLSEEKVNELFEISFKDLKMWSEKYHSGISYKTYNHDCFYQTLGRCIILANILESESKFSKVKEVAFDFVLREGE